MRKLFYYSTWSRLKRDDRGAVAVEFGLTIPIFLAVFLFVLEMGRLAFAQVMVSYAAEEATRFAVVNSAATVQQIQDYARDRLIGLSPENLTAILVAQPVDPVDQTRLISVEVEYLYSPLVSLDGLLENGGFVDIPIEGISRGFIAQ